MQVVYIDSLFVLNALMDYLLLLASARVAGEPLHRVRILLASLLGGGYAVAMFIPGGTFLSGVVYKVAAAVGMVLIGLGASRRLLRQIIIFFALSCALGGGIFAIAFFGGKGLQPAHGMLYMGVDMKIVLLSAAVCYVVAGVVLRNLGRRSLLGGELASIDVQIGDRRINFTALRDTGNSLADPVSGRGIIVADWDVVQPLFGRGEGPGQAELSDPAAVLNRLNTGRWKGRFGLVSYRAVGVACGLLLTLRPDRVCVAGRECGRVCLALSPTPVAPNGGWRGLIGEGS